MQNTIPKISVIIPMWNAEQYIGETLDSINAQDYPNVEIIVIDDGSDDRSLEIVADKLVNAGDRIIRMKHLGVSVARNRGIAAATGDYIYMMDADDKLSAPDFFNRVMLAMHAEPDIDIAVVGMIDEKHGDKPTLDYARQKIYTRPNAKIKASQVARRPAVWRFIYRAQFLKEHNLEFEPGRVTSQDVMFTIPAMYYARKIVTVPGAYYWYRRAPLGAMRDPARAAAREVNKRVVWNRAVEFAVRHKFFLGFRRSFWTWVKLRFLGIEPQ